MNQRDSSLPPVCEDCGHRASLHHVEGCRALLLGARARTTRTCGCTTTLREILTALGSEQPAELIERTAFRPDAVQPAALLARVRP
jgi:hypothetical protein